MLAIWLDMNLSTNQNKINLELSYTHIWVNHPLHAQVKIDDRIVHYDLSGSKNVNVSKNISLDAGKHVLTIKVSQKNEHSVLLDHHNNIKNDSYININELYIDQINFAKIIESDSQLAQDNKQTVKRTKGIYHNGEWKLQFVTPTYDWLLGKLL